MNDLRMGALSLGLMVFALAGLPGLARADLTFQAEIKGNLYTDDASKQKIQCKDGDTVTFPNADVGVDALAAFHFDPTCLLDSANGVFGKGELFNDEPIDETAVVAIVTDNKGVESRVQVFAQEKIETATDELVMTLEYEATFVKDKTNGELDPPLKKVNGRMILTSEPGDQLFVGTFKTKQLLP